MTDWRFVLRSLLHHWRIQMAVGLGVVAGTAVLTGALLVGDSVRGSLRHITLDRLGRVEAALLAGNFFRQELAGELASSPGFDEHFADALPVIMLRGTVEQPDSGRRANRVDVIGNDERFWSLGRGGPPAPPSTGEVILNAPLADELGVASGEEVILRFPQASDVPADSPLGRKTETVRNRRLRVAAIIPAEGLGRFGLQPNQQLPLIAYVATETLQSALDEPGRVNALLVAGHSAAPATFDVAGQLSQMLRPRLADYGLSLEETPRGYFNLTSERMLLDPAVEEAAMAAFAEAGPQAVFTYLANEMRIGERTVPYSTISGIDPVDEPPLGPFRTLEGDDLTDIGDDEIVLNAWAAESLEAKPGETVEVTYFEPESTHGRVEEATVSLRLRAVIELAGAADDRDLTPRLKGVTDQVTIADWDPPFPFEASRIRSEDEQYWDDHRATPKAFVSLATAQRLWGSRFGDTTSIRVPAAGGRTAEMLAASLDLDPAAMGFQFLPVKQLGLRASAGTTSFQGLFLGFSFFIIAAAVMLVVLLFRLGIENRAQEVGVLAAVGFEGRHVRRLLAWEGLMVALIAGVLGTAAGVGYAWLMLTALRTWWLAAITTPFLQLYVGGWSLVIGYVCGVLVSLGGIAWALRRMRHLSVRRLLANRAHEEASTNGRGAGWPKIAAVVMLIVALGLAGVAMQWTDEAQAGAFFGSGALVLAALLLLLWVQLRGGTTPVLIAASAAPLPRLALRNAGRNPGRTALTIGLVAAASFLIVAISAFRLDPPGEIGSKESGTGGFALVAESDQPYYGDINRFDQLSLTTAEAEALEGTQAIALPVQPGDDASCLNLYQVQRPQVLGITEPMIERGGFAWSATAAATDEERANPWRLLNRTLEPAADGSPRVPVILDANTATYSLHLDGIGAHYATEDGRGRRVTLEVVGLLKNSIFQGALLLGERDFREHFPDVSGFQFFLIAAPVEQIDQVAQQLERALGDYGFAAMRTTRRLEGFFAVQNTYLSTFQSLGGLGLLLGTFGLAVVELRNVLERRGELALMRATGFRRGRLARLVLLENLVLLLGGLAIGLAAALVAVAPHLLEGGARIPWQSLAGTLALVVLVGLLAGLAAVRATLRAPLLPALRGD